MRRPPGHSASKSPSGNILLRSPADIGALAQSIRRQHGLTQAELAEQAGVGRRFLIELESGKETAQVGKTLRVLAMLGVVLTGSTG